MKKRTFLQILSAIIFITMANSVPARTGPFEGIITYKITYPDCKYNENFISRFPKQCEIIVKGDKVKTEIIRPMGEQTDIINFVDETKISLITLRNQHFALLQTIDEIREANKGKPGNKVQITDETKVIAGYTCKKAILTVLNNGSENEIEVWFTRDIGTENANFHDPLFNHIPGVMFEFSILNSNMIMKFTAVSVENKEISPEEFMIPDGYPLITQEELKIKLGRMK